MGLHDAGSLHDTGLLSVGALRAAGVAGRVGRGWHVYRLLPGFGVPSLPRWPCEVALSVELAGPAAGGSGAGVAGRSALLALRAPGVTLPLLERLRGAVVLGGVGEGRTVTLADPVGLPGLAAAGLGEVRRHLALAGTRGIGDRDPGTTMVAGMPLGARTDWHAAYGLRRGGRAARHCRGRGGEVRWAIGAGAEVRAAGPCGRSVQSIVALYGDGDAELLVPPPGGALVLRAWRSGTEWQVVCAVVVASGVGAGTGRAAGRLARSAITRSWDAEVLTGPEALIAARAGDPRQRSPVAVARPLPTAVFRRLLGHCLRIAAAGSAAPALEAPRAGPASSTLTGLPRVLEELTARPLPPPQDGDGMPRG